MSRPPETLTIEESEKLLERLNTPGKNYPENWKHARNYTIALLMLDAGLRVGEVVRLKVNNLVVCNVPVGALDMTSELAEKKCERLIPLSNRALEAIRKMHTLRWSDWSEVLESYAFFEHNIHVHIGVRQVQRIIGKASLSAIGRKIHPHVLRHTFATRLMRVTSMNVVQQLLGHKHITSTQVYTHPNGDDCKKAIAAIQQNSL